jgi:hypothetical protein
VLFTDADCEPAPGWIERMIAPFGDAQVVGVKGVYRTRQRELVARFVQLEYEDRYDRMARHMARERRIDFVDTYAAGYRRDLFLANGGFDRTFATASVEDQEFSFRLAGQGYRLVFAPQAVVYHWGHAATLWAYARKKLKIGYHKFEVLRRYRDKVWQDAHTPQVLKVQMVLFGVAGVCLIAGLLWPPLAWGAAGAGALFLLSCIPFTWKAWRSDPLVALVSPGLLLLRGLALSLGLAGGIVRYLWSEAASRLVRDGEPPSNTGSAPPAA